MKIEIEWNCSYEAVLRIDGRELKVIMKPGYTSLKGLPDHEIESTLGGMIADVLYNKVADAMQAEAIAYEETAMDSGLTWKRLSNVVANAVYNRLH